MAAANRGGRPVSSTVARAPRADAVANRRRILDAAAVAFDAEGVRVSLDEIARRAGVGPGTVHRHFPSKAALIDATVAERITELAGEAADLDQAVDPVAAFLGFLLTLAERGAASPAFADRLRGESGDIDTAVAGPVADLRSGLVVLLERAQRAGGIRVDLAANELDAVVAALHVLQVHPHGGSRLVRIFCDALRTR
jgi:AcrR family transcriptional regulator